MRRGRAPEIADNTLEREGVVIVGIFKARSGSTSENVYFALDEHGTWSQYGTRKPALDAASHNKVQAVTFAE